MEMMPPGPAPALAAAGLGVCSLVGCGGGESRRQMSFACCQHLSIALPMDFSQPFQLPWEM